MKAFKLGKMTLGSVFKQPETVCYPLVRKPVPKGKRGIVECAIVECIFCGMCARCCPADAIKVDKSDNTWSLNRYRCVQCASCVDKCLQDCLSMSTDSPQVVAKISKIVLRGEVEDEC